MRSIFSGVLGLSSATGFRCEGRKTLGRTHSQKNLLQSATRIRPRIVSSSSWCGAIRVGQSVTSIRDPQEEAARPAQKLRLSNYDFVFSDTDEDGSDLALRMEDEDGLEPFWEEQEGVRSDVKVGGVEKENEKTKAPDVLERIRPKTLNCIHNRSQQKQLLRQYLRQFEHTATKAPSKPVCLLLGPTGVAKTATLTMLLRDLEYHIVEINPTNATSTTDVSKRIRKACASRRHYKKTILLLEGIDAASGSENGGGGILPLGRILRTILTQTARVVNRTPIICTLTTRRSELRPSRRGGIHSIRKQCQIIEFPSLQPDTLRKVACDALCRLGWKDVDNERINRILQHSDGDARAVLNCIALEYAGGKPTQVSVGSVIKRDTFLTMFDAARVYFTPAPEDRELLDNAVHILHCTGHMSGGIALHNYAKHADGDVYKIADAAKNLSTYDVLNHSRYQVQSDSIVPQYLLGLTCKTLTNGSRKTTRTFVSGVPSHFLRNTSATRHGTHSGTLKAFISSRFSNAPRSRKRKHMRSN